MRVIGIDPGLATVGIGVLDVLSPGSVEVREWLTIETSPVDSLAQRLCEIEHDLSEYLDSMKPDLAVIEDLYFAANEKTAITVAQARGVILQTIAARKIEIIEPTPLQLKSSITGDGRADKQQVQEMLVRELMLDAIPRPDDAADGLALALFGALHYSKPTAIA